MRRSPRGLQSRLPRSLTLFPAARAWFPSSRRPEPLSRSSSSLVTRALVYLLLLARAMGGRVVGAASGGRLSEEDSHGGAAATFGREPSTEEEEESTGPSTGCTGPVEKLEKGHQKGHQKGHRKGHGEVTKRYKKGEKGGSCPLRRRRAPGYPRDARVRLKNLKMKTERERKGTKNGKREGPVH